MQTASHGVSQCNPVYSHIPGGLPAWVISRSGLGKNARLPTVLPKANSSGAAQVIRKTLQIKMLAYPYRNLQPAGTTARFVLRHWVEDL